MSIPEILANIRRGSRFLICAHIHPEGDSIGSQLAMLRLLKALNKTGLIVNADPVPDSLGFLPGADRITCPGKAAARADAVIVLDCPNLDRIGSARRVLPVGKPVLNIDHHVSNSAFGTVNWIDPRASSAGEMVYRLFNSAGVKIDPASALCLYAAIMTDTGSFRYSNTRPDTLRVAADLLERGIEPAKIYQRLYETKSFASFKLLGKVLSRLNRTAAGKIIWFSLSREDLRQVRLAAEDTDDFIDYVRRIDSARVVAFLRELDSGTVKVSLRSKGEVDVNRIAGHFGGGGHIAASGCVIKGSIKQAERLLLPRLRRSLKEDPHGPDKRNASGR